MSAENDIFQKEKNIKMKEEKDEDENDEEDEFTDEITQECTICFTPLNSTGEHQISSLKCGHIFGKCCIKQWLNKKRNDNHSKCPVCGKNASIKDIYPVYSKFMTVDEKELEKEKEDTRVVKRRKLDTEKEFQTIFESYNELVQKVNDSKAEIDIYKGQLSKINWNYQQQYYSVNKFSLVSTWKISNKHNTSRIFTFNDKDNIIYVTKSNNLFEHGILGINLETNKALLWIKLLNFIPSITETIYYR